MAAELRQRGVPYLTATSYGEMVQHELAGTLLSKPYSMNQLLTAISSLFEPGDAAHPDQARQA